jgi:hypothetical protein
MTPTEKRLLGTVAKMVMRIARHLGLDDDALEVQKAAHLAQHEMLEDNADNEYGPVVALLELEGIKSSVEHTGGGIFLVGIREPFADLLAPGAEDDEDRPYIWISDESEEIGHWAMAGYLTYTDEGTRFMATVPLEDVPKAVNKIIRDMREYLMTELAASTLTKKAVMAFEDDGDELSIQDGRMVYRITDTTWVEIVPEGRYYTLMGYRNTNDPGEIITEDVPLAGLVEATREAVKQVRTERTWQVPGNFLVIESEDKMEFKFMPAEAFAGYFGTPTLDYDTGNPLDSVYPDVSDFWDKVGGYLGPEGQFTATWES